MKLIDYRVLIAFTEEVLRPQVLNLAKEGFVLGTFTTHYCVAKQSTLLTQVMLKYDHTLNAADRKFAGGRCAP